MHPFESHIRSVPDFPKAGIVFKTAHRAHHESRVPTAWTAFAFHPLEATIQAAILPLLLLAFPIHWAVLVFFLSTMTALGIVNHLGSELYPEWVRKRAPFSYLINAGHHQKHHQRPGWNFGLYFTFWDRWMGTEHE